MQKTRVNLIGAGAIGHLWSMALLRNHQDAVVYSTRERPANNIKFTTDAGSSTFALTYRRLEDIQSSAALLICVKAYQLEEVLCRLKSVVIEPCPVILMMNGMGLVELARHHLPEFPVVHASVTHGVYLEENTLHHTGIGQTLLGNLDNLDEFAHFKTLTGQLNQALPPVIWQNNHLASMNLKLVVNAVINPVTAMLGCKNGQIIHNGNLIAEAETLLIELIPLLPWLLPDQTIDWVREQIIQVASNTAANSSSMLRDIENNRPTEIDFITGYLIRLAKKHSINLPNNSQMLTNIKQLEP